MRELFVSNLIKEVLGPRNGLNELMEDSPLNEYITGVLAPVDTDITTDDPEPEMDVIGEESELQTEDDFSDQDVNSPPLLSPVLDPKRRPSSMGISFAVRSESDDSPGLRLCVTWARYYKKENGWVRVPRYFVSDVIKVDGTRKDIWLKVDNCVKGIPTTPGDGEISIHCMFDRLSSRSWMVRIFLVNRIRLNGRLGAGVEDHIFQPQIRVTLTDKTSLAVSKSFPEFDDDEEKIMDFLYRDRPVLARGHLCSAVWRDIDPEREPEGQLKVEYQNAMFEPPFYWIDGALLPDEMRKLFSPPDVRSEFVPIYPVASPLMDWNDTYGPRPELRPDKLSEMWDPEEVERYLQPLVNGYRRWIAQLRNSLDKINESYRDIACKLIKRCENVAERMQRGIELIKADENVRLAFCFANRAIALQATWKKSGLKEWRPFQLGFILMVIESIVKPDSPDRDVCDLLWVGTGGGKTEAYLGIAAFVLAYRRRRALTQEDGDRTGAGVAVISRYTLRLLSIQQFRRALALISACEYLRIYNLENGKTGWRPRKCSINDEFIWGSSRFSIGLWVGGNVTPNRLTDFSDDLPGALSLLKRRIYERRKSGGEPAQVLRCPCCNAILSVADKRGLEPGIHELHLVIKYGKDRESLEKRLNKERIRGISSGNVRILDYKVWDHRKRGYFTLSLKIETADNAGASDIDELWSLLERRVSEIELVPARASRNGYFIRWYKGIRSGAKCEYDFDIFCPNPRCSLRIPWCEGTPSGAIFGTTPHSMAPKYIDVNGRQISLPDGNRAAYVNEAFRLADNTPYVSDRIPITAYTVDEQVYHRCPSMIISTVDKFARPSFEPRAAAIFGNVTHHHCTGGYYRKGSPPYGSSSREGHAEPLGNRVSRCYVEVNTLNPPDLIIQDELHLIEGPLGSMAGFYETAVDFICSEPTGRPVKYIASTATIQRADEQIMSVYSRKVAVFPPPGLSVNDSFFIRVREIHPLDDKVSGRLYVGICAPGRGPLTPTVRIWSRLLQTAYLYSKDTEAEDISEEIDPYWTLVGYFNAIRELAGAVALCRQDIPERMKKLWGHDARNIGEDHWVELSGRKTSTELPSILNELEKSYPKALDVLFTTSMFGTGVDIQRLGLMVVQGQPKTTSAYIQATGRVGRKRGALVVTFYRATRPRDLNHYEFFCGYHHQLYRFVEPVTVMPFAPGVLDRSCGPVCVFILRNRFGTDLWHNDDSAWRMRDLRTKAPEVLVLPKILGRRAQMQPPMRKPDIGEVEQFTESELDRWHDAASRHSNDLKYVEYGLYRQVSKPVVLGDIQHKNAKLDVVYENAPQSLRDIEGTCTFKS